MTKAKKETGKTVDPEKTLDGLIRAMRATLKKEGLYKPEMARQVELTASTLMVFRKVRDVVLNVGEDAMIEEKSREGDARIKNNPAFFLYKEMADLLQRNLRALNMNKELTRGKDDKTNESEEDPLERLMAQQNDDN